MWILTTLYVPSTRSPMTGLFQLEEFSFTGASGNISQAIPASAPVCAGAVVNTRDICPLGRADQARIAVVCPRPAIAPNPVLVSGRISRKRLVQVQRVAS